MIQQSFLLTRTPVLSTLEWGAIETGVKQATEEQRQKMMSYLDNLERAETEEERVRWDKAIHYLLIEASGNFCMLANYKALNKIMDEYIPKMRGKIIRKSQCSRRMMSSLRRSKRRWKNSRNLMEKIPHKKDI